MVLNTALDLAYNDYTYLLTLSLLQIKFENRNKYNSSYKT